jgi:hypothetical protein
MAEANTVQGIMGGVPLGGQVMSVIVTLAALTVLTLFLSKLFPTPLEDTRGTRTTYSSDTAQRSLAVRTWRRLPYVVWCE